MQRTYFDIELWKLWRIFGLRCTWNALEPSGKLTGRPLIGAKIVLFDICVIFSCIHYCQKTVVSFLSSNFYILLIYYSVYKKPYIFFSFSFQLFLLILFFIYIVRLKLRLLSQASRHLITQHRKLYWFVYVNKYKGFNRFLDLCKHNNDKQTSTVVLYF